MLTETLEAAEVVSHQLASDETQYDEFGALLRSNNQHAMLTLARGSSDHAAHYLAYLTMLRMVKRDQGHWQGSDQLAHSLDHIGARSGRQHGCH